MENIKKLEIERKYLLKCIPENLESYKHIEMEQGYISTVPVVRIRKKLTHSGDAKATESYVLTIKSSGMLTRQEYEMDITAEEYENLKDKVEGNIITKARYVIPLNDMLADSSDRNTISIPDDINRLVLELDIFCGAFSGLVMGEVEFPDEKTADSFEAAGLSSNIFCKEVTFDKRFHNSTMSNMSQAEILEFIKDLG